MADIELGGDAAEDAWIATAKELGAALNRGEVSMILAAVETADASMMIPKGSANDRFWLHLRVIGFAEPAPDAVPNDLAADLVAHRLTPKGRANLPELLELLGLPMPGSTSGGASA